MTYTPPTADERVHLDRLLDGITDAVDRLGLDLHQLLRDLANAADHDRAPTVLDRLHAYAEDLELDLPAPDWWFYAEDEPAEWEDGHTHHLVPVHACPRCNSQG